MQFLFLFDVSISVQQNMKVLKRTMVVDFTKSTLIRSSTLRKTFPYSELFWPTFSRIRTQYGEIQSISPFSVRMQENTYQNNSEYNYLLRSGWRNEF